jgi:hypothetical protein
MVAKKKTYFNKQICNSKNKIKPTWNVVKTITGRIPINNDIHSLNIVGKIIRNNKSIFNYFIEHFLTITDIITNKMKTIANKDITCPMKYLHISFKNPFLNIMIKHAFQIEIEIEKLQYLWV